MNKRHYEHTLLNIRGSLSNTYGGKYNISIIIHLLNLTIQIKINISSMYDRIIPQGRKVITI